MADSNFRKEKKKGICVKAEGRNVEIYLFQQKYFYFLLIISIKYKTSYANPV